MGNAGYGNHTQDPGDPQPPDPQAGRTAPPGKAPAKGGPGLDDAPPAAGSHAEPSLTNPDATPGAGTLTPPGGHEGTDSVTG